MKYQYILFDADDTLLDYEKSEIVALQKLFHSYGIRCTASMEGTFVRLCNKLWHNFRLDQTADPYISRHYHEIYYEYSVKRFDIIADQYGLKIPARQLSNQYILELSKCNFLTDGAYEICRKLSAACKISVITNGLWSMQKMRFERSRIGPFISNLIVSENARYAKPNFNFFEYAMRKSDIHDKSAVLIVGDSLSNDIYGGSSFGIDTCWFNRKQDRNNSKICPTYQICSLYDLKHVLY